MQITVKGQVGPQTVGDGTEVEMSLSRDRSQRVQDSHARYQEAVSRGMVYKLATAAAGVTVAAANVFSAAAAQPIVGIFNPSGSAFSAVILRAIVIWDSGTPAAGGLVWGVIPSTGITAITGFGSALDINALTFATGGSGMRTYQNQALTGLAASGVSLLAYNGGPSVGALAANSNQTYMEEVAGEIICRPGQVVGLFAAAAGTSPVVNASISYELIASAMTV